MNKLPTVALVGNPNCGKTLIFNRLTHSWQPVGNWAGATVARHEGIFQYKNQKIRVVDLPGIYSTVALDHSSIDTTIACNYLLSEDVDVVINILDGSHLVRSLYLTLQILEIGIPVVLVVNMMDVAHKQGLQLNIHALTDATDCPVVSMNARSLRDCAPLKSAILKQIGAPSDPSYCLPSHWMLHVREAAEHMPIHTKIKTSRAVWRILHFLEGDCSALKEMDLSVQQAANAVRTRMSDALQEEVDVYLADLRYRKASHIADCVTSIDPTIHKKNFNFIDRWILNRWFGIPIFLSIMYLLFASTMYIGGSFQELFQKTGHALLIQCPEIIFHPAQTGLIHWVITCLGEGVCTVLSFVPIIGVMFLFLSFLEDSGYMARAAFIMDRLMQWLGLPGRAFIPMIVGFGCNVPALMGTRILSDPKDRILTILMMPFMSCGARLAVFSVFAAAFFPHHAASVILMLYLVGIAVAVLTGFLLRRFLFQGALSPWVMELPPYHLPSFFVLWRQTWKKLKGFVWDAGKYIVPICALVGILDGISWNGAWTTHQHSVLSQMSRSITPVLSPIGISQDNWPATVALLTGALAKEVIIGTLNTLYSTHQEHTQDAQWLDVYSELKEALISVPKHFLNVFGLWMNPIESDQTASAFGVMWQFFDGVSGALAYLLFILLYFPCLSTVVVMKKEIGFPWACFSVLWSSILAYILALTYYQCATFFRHEWMSVFWILTSWISLLIIGYLSLRSMRTIQHAH